MLGGGAAYLIFVVSALSSARVKFLLSVKKFQNSEKITVLGSVYIAAVNVLFHTKCAILHSVCNVALTVKFEIYVCFVAGQFCRKFMHFPSVKFS